MALPNQIGDRLNLAYCFASSVQGYTGEYFCPSFCPSFSCSISNACLAVRVCVCRGLGTHVSFVRSVALDSWTEKQIQQMRAGGNTRCIEFLKKQGINMSTETPIREKYDTAAAELYRQVLLARVEGRPEPTEITATTAASNSQPARPTAPVVDPSRLIGFGSTPLPEPEPEVNAIGIATGATIVVGTAIIWAVSSL